MSIIENAEKTRHKAQSAVATARLSGYKLISQARTEKARAAARAVSGHREAATSQRQVTRASEKTARANGEVARANGQVSRTQGGIIRTANKKVA